jgi:hypothetical protein
MMRQITFALCLSLCASIARSGVKERHWQEGKLLDNERARYYVGSVGNNTQNGSAQTNGTYGTYQGSGSSSTTALYRVWETFVIEGETHLYIAQERLRWRWSKPANLTVNGPVEFAVEKRKLFVMDDDGREHEMEIVKQVLKSPPRQQ